MEVRAECSKKVDSTTSEDPGTFVPSTKEFNKNLFIHGAISYWVESLNSHFESESKKATNHYLAVQQTKNLNKEKHNIPSTGQHFKSVLKEAVKKNLQSLFINVHAVLKEGKPFTEYEYQVKVDKAKEVDIGETYLNWSGAVQFAKAINDHLMTEFAKEFKEAKFFCIILDESTDSNRMEQCVLLICYSMKGNAKTNFLSIDSISDPTANQITSLFKKC